MYRLFPAAAAKSHWLCPALCDPIDGSPPGSSVPGILQARILGWVAISFSNGQAVYPCDYVAVWELQLLLPSSVMRECCCCCCLAAQSCLTLLKPHGL